CWNSSISVSNDRLRDCHAVLGLLKTGPFSSQENASPADLSLHADRKQCTCVKQAVRVSDLPPQRNQHSITEPRSCLPLNAVKSALANLSGAWLSRHRNFHASPHPLSSACRYPVLGAELVSAGSTPDYFFRSL